MKIAGADYLKCEICAERIMYEPNADPDIKAVCMECYNIKFGPCKNCFLWSTDKTNYNNCPDCGGELK